MSRYLTAMIIFPEKHCILYHFQGIRRIHIGCKLQEAAACYQEGFSCVYIACAGTNTQQLIDLLEMMFGDLDEPNLEELETERMKQMRAQAALAEEADIISVEGAISKGGITKIVVTNLPVPQNLVSNQKCSLKQIQSGKLTKRIPPRKLLNSIMLATNALTLPKTNQVCSLMPAAVLISN